MAHRAYLVTALAATACVPFAPLALFHIVSRCLELQSRRLLRSEECGNSRDLRQNLCNHCHSRRTSRARARSGILAETALNLKKGLIPICSIPSLSRSKVQHFLFSGPAFYVLPGRPAGPTLGPVTRWSHSHSYDTVLCGVLDPCNREGEQSNRPATSLQPTRIVAGSRRRATMDRGGCSALAEDLQINSPNSLMSRNLRHLSEDGKWYRKALLFITVLFLIVGLCVVSQGTYYRSCPALCMSADVRRAIFHPALAGSAGEQNL